MATLESFVENLVTWMAMSSPSDRHARSIPVATFTGAYPLLNGCEMLDDACSYTPLIYTGAKPSDLDHPLDQAMLGNIIGSRSPSDTWSMQRVRLVRDRRKLRGRVPERFAAGLPVFELLFGLVECGEYKLASRNFYALTPDGRWLWVGPQTLGGGGDAARANHWTLAGREERDGSMVQRLQIALGVQLLRELSWSVEIGYVGHPTVQFVTDGEGAKEAFRLRDLPEGRARRAALLHWVNSHWRRRPEPKPAVEVKRHMRGAERFVWNGLRCNITPSAADMRAAIAAGLAKPDARP